MFHAYINSISFQVLLTPTHLAIVMEYAAGGELFERICNAGRFSEDEVEHTRVFLYCLIDEFLISSLLISLEILRQARFFFQQLISGVSYCHSMVSLELPQLHIQISMFSLDCLNQASFFIVANMSPGP